MKTWLTADLHFGEDRLELMSRPFRNQKEHVTALIKNLNSFVEPEDTLIINGDVCYQKTPEFLSEVKLLHGRKILIRGNHDRVFSDSDLKPYFEEIVPEGEGKEMVVEGIHCYVTHYPTEGKINRFNLTGHVHAIWKYQLNMFNVGVDVNHFMPVNIDKIPFHFKAIKDFYDNDAWVAYNELNASFVGVRGKQGKYFNR